MQNYNYTQQLRYSILHQQNLNFGNYNGKLHINKQISITNPVQILEM